MSHIVSVLQCVSTGLYTYENSEKIRKRSRAVVVFGKETWGAI